MSRLIVPGWQGSGVGHWQRCWLEVDADARIVEQANWELPRLGAWIDRLDAAVRKSPHSTLVAHSLGAVLVAHYAKLFPDAPVAAALLVAPADVDALPEGHVLADFAPAPAGRTALPEPLLAISHNDPYISVERGQLFAERWGSELVDLGDAGHVNAESGHGRWPEGFRLAARLDKNSSRAAA